MKLGSIDVPCVRDCPDREPGCHGKCEKYAEFQRQIEERRELTKSNPADGMLVDNAQARRNRYNKDKSIKLKSNSRRYR